MAKKKKVDFKDGPVTFGNGDEAKIEYTIDGDDNVSSEMTVPAESAMAGIEKAVDTATPVETDAGFKTEFKGTINKSTAERLANRLNALEKGAEIDLESLTEQVVSQIEELHKEKARRTQQNRRTIASLRSSDPPGKKTCGRCGFRVDTTKMDVKKELCEVCAS